MYPARAKQWNQDLEETNKQERWELLAKMRATFQYYRQRLLDSLSNWSNFMSKQISFAIC